jgi:hypothetical protein
MEPTISTGHRRGHKRTLQGNCKYLFDHPPELSYWCYFDGAMAKKMEEGERRHVLLLLRPALRPLHCGGRLRLYLTIPRSLSLACSKKGYCAGAVVKWIISYAGKMFGVHLVSKLRAILLMEVDFNAIIKRCMVFGCLMRQENINLSRRRYSVKRIG